MVKRRAPKGREFYLHDGTEVSTIEELYNYLKEASDGDYSKHTSHNSNDFASWVKEVHGKTFLARTLRSAKNRQEAIAVLHEEIRKYEKLANKLKQRELRTEHRALTHEGDFITKEFVFGLIFGFVLGLLLMGALNAL